MKFRFDKKLLVPLILGLFLVAVTGFWGYDQYRARQRVEIFLGNKYQQAFYELVENVEQLQVLLGKSLVSASPNHNIVNLTDVWSRASIAQQELNRLPISEEVIFNTSKFLSQVGDYAHVMAKNNAEGRVLTEENRERLNDMRQQAAQISSALNDLQSRVLEGEINITDIVRAARYRLAEQEPNDLMDGFTDVEEDLTQFPVLIYDGPFSDHIKDFEPKGLTGGEITQEEARDRVQELVDLRNKEDIEISEGTTIDGRIPSFNFQVQTGEGLYAVDISQKGGHLVNMINNRVVESTSITEEEARNKAQEYLAAINYENMEPTYSQKINNTIYISFAYQEDDIVFYPDIINVQVALDNGQILAVEALSYLMTHQERELEEVEISPEQAKEMIANNLEIDNVQLALIPTNSMREVLTYEIRVKVGEEVYLIYIDAKTGDEVQILKLINVDQGTFTL